MADAARPPTKRFVPTTKQHAAAGMTRRLGRGTAALGLKRVAAVRNAVACYTESVSLDHLARGGCGSG